MLLRENITGQKACYKTRFQFKRKSNLITFHFVAYNSKLYSFSNVYNSELYRGDVCEVFIYYGKENHYYEIEVAPNGTIFLADIENIDGKTTLKLIDKCFISAKTKIGKSKYVVDIKVPLDKIPTKQIKFNAFRIDTDGGKENAHLFALHPTLSKTFHKIEFIY